MTFGPHRKSEETYLAYTRADDSFRQLGRHVSLKDDRTFVQEGKIVSLKICHFPEFFLGDHEFFSHQPDKFRLLIFFTKK